MTLSRQIFWPGERVNQPEIDSEVIESAHLWKSASRSARDMRGGCLASFCGSAMSVSV
jgi:hypothetical protein